MNTLYYGDNLSILREYVRNETVDLIYLDPPFNSNRSYNILFKEESGRESDTQMVAFDDSWHWGESAERTYHELVTTGPNDVAAMISSLRQFIGTNQMMAYLVMMAARLGELHRVLKPTGSLYLHCDPTASHYLKVILDTIFGAENFRNDIVWVRSTNPKGSQFDPRKFSPYTDNILFYSKSPETPLHYDRVKIVLSEEELGHKYDRKDEVGPYYDGPILRSASMGPRPNLVYEYKGYTPGPAGWRMTRDKLEEIDHEGNLGWSTTGKPFRKLRPEADKGDPIGSFWNDISLINSQAAERLGYPTQKPLALLERIILASSNPGDVVLDPFSGCGTAIAAAQKLGRRWIGIDITHLAISMHKNRLKDLFNLVPGKDYQVIGEPQDMGAARQLAKDDRYQFQWWALSLVQARPLGGNTGDKTGRKGSDRGIDGLIFFIDEAKGQPKQILIQVKSGHVRPTDIRDLRGVMQREKNSPIGVFITLEPPTSEMVQEAISAGFYTSDLWQKNYPRLQILTIEELLAGKTIQMPPSEYATFKRAPRLRVESEQQGRLDI